MSIGAELLIRDIADTMETPVIFSEHGDGCPLLDEAAHPPIRLARRPVGGVIRRDGVATFAPPLNILHRANDSARLAYISPVIVDALAFNPADLLTSIRAFTPDAPAALRVRGGFRVPGQTFSDPLLKMIYEDPTGADHIYLRRDLITDDLIMRANALMAAEVDEFDALTAAIGHSGVIKSIRHGAGLSEAVIHPAAMLDQPSDQQIAIALADGRVMMAADGGCALFIPQLSGIPMPVSICVGGLEAGAPDPEISFPNAQDWTVTITRDDGDWRAIARPAPSAAPLVSVLVEVEAPDSPAAEITEGATAITRKRGSWEIWDEAQQQLELEESW